VGINYHERFLVRVQLGCLALWDGYGLHDDLVSLPPLALMENDMDRMQEEVKRRVSRRLEERTWFREIPTYLVPTTQQIHSVGFVEASITLERWMILINEKEPYLR